jgi:hypothetical protein
MRYIEVKKSYEDCATIEQLPAKRDWMDETRDKHAYMCFPISVTNRLGWGISFPEDIVFTWDGITDTSPDHITILKGHKYADTTRGNATISFKSGLVFKTDDQTTMLTMPTPNLFIRGAQCYTTLISTSFYLHSLPLAWRATEPNIEITIPAGTPVATVVPLSLTSLESDYELQIAEGYATQEYWEEVKKYGDAAEILNGVGDWSKMYRDAVNYKGEKVGNHETKSIKLKTVTCPHTGKTYEVEGDHDE